MAHALWQRHHPGPKAFCRCLFWQGPGASPAGDWRAIDFGIARRYTSDTGAVLPRREEYAEFRGSTTYASIHAHLKQDLGTLSWLMVLATIIKLLRRPP